MEKVPSDSPVFLLVKPKDGRRRPGRKTVILEKGELVQELEQPYPTDHYSHKEHNFHVYSNTAVTLNCGATDVLPLEGVEHLYLLAVSTKDRMKEFNNEHKREYVMGLKMGDQVFFDYDASPGRGRIRYIGAVQKREGVYLGVEIDEDDKYRGRGTTNGHPFFDCGRKNAVWVSMDMVIYPPPSTGRHEDTRLQREIAHLKRENDNQKLEIVRLQEDNDQKQKQVTNLQSRLAQQPKVVPDSDISFWLVSRDEVRSTSHVLGEGAWGKVTVGMFRGQKVAIKEIHSTIRSKHNDELVFREISLMAKVRHPNLLLFIAAVQNTPSRIDPIFITELLDTDLRNAYQDGRLTNNRVRISILRDVAAALNYLHLQREPIIHRDVSSANVLLQALPDNWWRGKLSDFGSANLVRDATTAAPGAAVYCAPEAFVEGKQSPKIDVYSYGKLFCEVFTSQFPYTKAFPSMLQSMAHSWPQMHKIIIRCVEHDPVNRPTMSSIVDQLNVFTQ